MFLEKTRAEGSTQGSSSESLEVQEHQSCQNPKDLEKSQQIPSSKKDSVTANSKTCNGQGFCSLVQIQIRGKTEMSGHDL